MDSKWLKLSEDHELEIESSSWCDELTHTPASGNNGRTNGRRSDEERAVNRVSPNHFHVLTGGCVCNDATYATPSSRPSIQSKEEDLGTCFFGPVHRMEAHFPSKGSGQTERENEDG